MANTWGTVMIIVKTDIPPNKPRSFLSDGDAVAAAFAGSWIIDLPSHCCVAAKIDHYFDSRVASCRGSAWSTPQRTAPHLRAGHGDAADCARRLRGARRAQCGPLRNAVAPPPRTLAR